MAEHNALIIFHKNYQMNYFLFEEPEDMPDALRPEDSPLFTHCKQCQQSLQDPPKAYTLEKVFKRYPNTPAPQVLFEYAICDVCASDIREEFSEESAQNMERYFAAKLQEREQPIEVAMDERLSKCLLKNTPLIEEQEFAIVARGFGDKMLQSHYPFAISLSAMDELQELISEKTRDLLDDFVGKNFPGPPEFETVPVDGKWVLV